MTMMRYDDAIAKTRYRNVLQQYDDDIMLTTTIMTYDKAIAKVLLL